MADKNSNVTEGWPKWQIAAAVGATGALGLAGLWYYRRKRTTVGGESDDKATKNASKEKSKEKELTPLEKAQAAKNKGNKYFKGGKYDQAIHCYTEAISVCPARHGHDIATFYQNRAAAHEQLKSSDSVIADCTNALEHNKRYTKALFRRAKAYETTKNLTKCLEDVTAVCILESFQNQQSLVMADRVLKELGKSKAKEAYKNRNPVEPSSQFIRTYFSAFANDPILAGVKSGHSNRDEAESRESPEVEKQQDETLEEKHQDETLEKEKIEEMEKTDVNKTSAYIDAIRCLNAKEYGDVVKHCSEEINLSSPSHLSEALLLRATFYLLRGEGNKAMEDFDRLLDIPNGNKEIRSNALIKRGSLKMQNGQQTDALDDFATAVREDPENSDIYHHRGQLNLLIDRVEDAVKDFERSVKLSPQFAIAHVQKCYTEYRLAFARRSPMQLQSAMKNFEDTVENFSDCAEGYALFGQALCDQQDFETADKNFVKALGIEPDNGNICVHRGLLRLQWKENIDEAAKQMNKALEVDPKCEFAYETLGTIEIQRGNLDAAIGLFTKAISLAKTEVEMAHLYSLLDAAVAQSQVARNLGIQVPGMPDPM